MIVSRAYINEISLRASQVSGSLENFLNEFSISETLPKLKTCLEFLALAFRVNIVAIYGVQERNDVKKISVEVAKAKFGEEGEKFAEEASKKIEICKPPESEGIGVFAEIMDIYNEEVFFSSECFDTSAPPPEIMAEIKELEKSIKTLEKAHKALKTVIEIAEYHLTRNRKKKNE